MKKPAKSELTKKYVDLLIKWVQLFFNSLAVASLIALATVVMIQITTRYLPIKSPGWTEELSRYLFIYMVMLAGAAVIFSDKHIKLDLFHDKLPEQVKLVYNIICHLIIAIFCIMLISYAWDYSLNGGRESSPTMGFKKVWVFISTVIFFVLTSLASILMIIRDSMLFIEKGKS